jgi:hypothetical protein
MPWVLSQTNTYDISGKLRSVTAPTPGNGGPIIVTRWCVDSGLMNLSVVNDLNKRWPTQNRVATSLAVILFLHNHLPSFRGGALYTHDYGDALGNRVRDDAPVLPRRARVPVP